MLFLCYFVFGIVHDYVLFLHDECPTYCLIEVLFEFSKFMPTCLIISLKFVLNVTA